MEPLAKKALLVFDKFKGTLSAQQVCRAVEEALHLRFSDLKINSIPIADGGDGFIDCMELLLKGSHTLERKKVDIWNPLLMNIQSEYLLDVENKTVYMEVANSAGLLLLEKE